MPIGLEMSIIWTRCLPIQLLIALGALLAVIAPGRAQASPVVGPEQSLNRAVASAEPGETVFVRRGAYPRLRLPAGRRLRGVTVKPAGSERPEISGVSIGRRAGGLRIEGFRITDVSQLDDVRNVAFVGNEFSPHGIVGAGRGLLFENNYLHDLTIHRDRAAPGPRCNRFSEDAGVAPRCGFAFRLSYSVGVVIRGNRMQRIPADGLQLLEMRDLLVEGNLFEDISAFGDPLEHSDSIQMLGDSDRVTIRGNFFRRARGILAQTFKGSGSQRRLVIENNVMVRLWHWGVNVYDAPGARIVSNTIWDTGGRGIGLTDDPNDPTPMQGAIVANNVVSSLRADPATMAFEDHNMIDEGTRGGAHDLSVRRPDFVDPEQSDYRLRSGSQGIGDGLGALAPATDVRGASRSNARDAAGPPDIGAYEFGARAALPPAFRDLGALSPPLSGRRAAPW